MCALGFWAFFVADSGPHMTRAIGQGLGTLCIVAGVVISICEVKKR